MIDGISMQESDPLFSSIWKWEGSEQILTFMWITFNDRLPTNFWRSSWSNASALCASCEDGPEDVLHILRDCKFAKDMWYNLLDPIYFSQFFSASLRDWGKFDLKRDLARVKEGKWHLIWGVAIWHLWKWRNNFIFMDDFRRPEYPSEFVLHIWKSFIHLQEPAVLLQPEPSEVVGWVCPDPGWVKTNVDGAVTRYASRAGCGGVIRDPMGQWVGGFTHFLGTCTAFEAEQWAILKGLSLTWDLGLRRVLLELDCKELVDILADASLFAGGSLLFQNIREFMTREWELKISFVPCEHNSLADALAKQGLYASSFLDVCPVSLRTLISQDCNGIKFPTVVS
ncbi:hypothetical protein QN277_010152 [Acacia crassicarpa]|nr:hypothetical protein QN277_010152 [Acacia crassicarpa]